MLILLLLEADTVLKEEHSKKIRIWTLRFNINEVILELLKEITIFYIELIAIYI